MSCLTPEMVRSAPTLKELRAKLDEAGVVDYTIRFRALCDSKSGEWSYLASPERQHQYSLCEKAGVSKVLIQAAVARYLLETKRERTMEEAIRTVTYD